MVSLFRIDLIGSKTDTVTGKIGSLSDGIKAGFELNKTCKPGHCLLFHDSANRLNIHYHTIVFIESTDPSLNSEVEQELEQIAKTGPDEQSRERDALEVLGKHIAKEGHHEARLFGHPIYLTLSEENYAMAYKPMMEGILGVIKKHRETTENDTD